MRRSSRLLRPFDFREVGEHALNDFARPARIVDSGWRAVCEVRTRLNLHQRAHRFELCDRGDDVGRVAGELRDQSLRGPRRRRPSGHPASRESCAAADARRARDRVDRAALPNRCAKRCARRRFVRRGARSSRPPRRRRADETPSRSSALPRRHSHRRRSATRSTHGPSLRRARRRSRERSATERPAASAL